jgi:surfeit locus 1 family protein
MQVLFNWKVTAFSTVCLLVFLRLGFWQLDRAEEKETMIVEQQTLRTSESLPAARLSDDTRNGTPVHLQGSYDLDRVFLLDNRILKGVVGYEVLMLFRDISLSEPLLVNLGFVPMGRTRSDLPEIPSPGNSSTADGYVYHQADQRPMLPAAGWPKVVQAVDADEISNIAKETIYPHLIRLSEDDPNALPRNWPLTVIQPEKHLGYAVQWFLMATAIVIAYGFFTLRRGRASDDWE